MTTDTNGPSAGSAPQAAPYAPRGFERLTVEGAHVLARSEAVSWSRRAISEYGSLYRAARDSAVRTLQGRGPVLVVTNPEASGPNWVVRRYFRGGLMRPFGDRFLRAGTPRPFVEVENSARIEGLGLATPRVVAAAMYPDGLVYRADLVTEFVPHARTLADVLFGGNGRSGEGIGRSARREALACAAGLITRLAKAGVHHPDLNAENILIARDTRRVHAILLDLDGCRVAGPSGPADAKRLRRRLARSIRKLESTRARLQNDREGHLTSDDIDELMGEGRAS